MPPALVRPPLREVHSRLFDSTRWADYRPREGDVVIATYPKCGTTWMERIVGMLLAGDPAPTPVNGPWFDFRVRGPVGPMLAMAEAMTGRRHLKSHLPFDALPVWEGVRFIHVARDGRDAALSFHNHQRGYNAETVALMDAVCRADPKFPDGWTMPPEDPAAYFRQWLNTGGDGGDPAGSYWHTERSYWAARARPDMLLVHYADLKAQPAAEIARIARFLGVALAPAVMDAVVAAADFAAMRADGERLMPNAERAWTGGAQTFLHQGVNGRWQGVSDPADLARYQAKTAEEFTPGLAAWLERGRLAAGDPETAAD